MAALAVAGLSTAAGIGFSNLVAAGVLSTEEALVAGVLSTGGLFAGGRLITRAIRGDMVNYSMKRQRIDGNNMAGDDYPVLAGDLAQANRTTQKRVLKRGRLGRKLNRENEAFVQRWARILRFGKNNNAYPLKTEEENPGCTNAYSWPTPAPAATNAEAGRMVLSHVNSITGQSNVQLLPGYLIDITCWNNSSNTYEPVPVKRMALDGSGNFKWIPYAQIFNSASDFMTLMPWGAESGPSGTGLPTSTEQKALLSWSDMRFVFYGARDACCRINLSIVQFKDGKYTFNFHPDGDAIGNMSQLDQNEVNQFWMNEFKKFVYNPADVNMFNRKKALTVLHGETFCINADNANDYDTQPAAVHKQYFKRFNRLVNWSWNRPNTTVSLVGANVLDNPDFQQADQGQLLGYTNPKARIYIYVRAEDFVPTTGTIALTDASQREISFDMVLRNKWIIQT